MERNLYYICSVALPLVAMLFIIDNYQEITISILGFSVLICSFLYRSSDRDDRKNFYIKSTIYVILDSALFLIVISASPRIETPLLSMIAVFFSVVHAKEVRLSRGWPPLLDFGN